MTDSSSLPREREIDGLRSLAIVPVLLYHSGWRGMPGGFAGVDIFFVISGYLIARLLAAEMADGRFSLLQFYERRARRIAPALIVMVVATGIAAALIMVPQDLARFGTSVVWTALFASNIFFAFNTGYFAAPTESYPLLHTWSLAVEEQFYLFFPLLLLGLMRWRPKWTVATITLLAALSLGLSIAASPSLPTLAFYLPLTRGWELWLGALLALGVTPQLPRWTREGVAAVALAAIGWTVFALPGRAAFPGWIALVPTLAAGVLIRYAPGTLVGRLLATPPLVGIGLISYSLYLWHWPLLSLATYWLMRPLTLPEGLGLVALSVPISILSWRLIEQPFRNRKFLSRHAVLSGTALGVVLLVAAGAGLAASGGLPQRLPPEAAQLSAFADDISPRRDDCHELNTPIPPERACALGASVPPTMAVWADSHGVELSYALGEIEGAAGHAVAEFTSSACSPGLGYNPPGRPDCATHNQAVLAHLLAHPEIATVVFAALVSGDNRAELDDILPGLRDAVTQLRAAGRQVVLLYPVPRVDGIVPTSLARLDWRDGRFDPRAYALGAYEERLNGTLAALDAIVTATGAIAVHPTDYYCPDGTCVTWRDGIVLYLDSHHPTLTAARKLAQMVVAAAGR